MPRVFTDISSPSSALDASDPYSAAYLKLLDDPQEWAAFSQRVGQTTQVWQSELLVEGVLDATAAQNLAESLKECPGVQAVRLLNGFQRLEVTWNALNSRPSLWLDCLQQAGYRALPARDCASREARRRALQMATLRWQLAAVCFGVVLLCSLPTYVGQYLQAEYMQRLRWMAWLFTLPLLFFCAQPIWETGWHKLRKGRVGLTLPLALALVVAAVASMMGLRSATDLDRQPIYFDSISWIVLAFLAFHWLQLRLADRSAAALEVQRNSMPESVERQTRLGTFERVAVRHLKVGDRIRIQPGETFVADGVIEQGATMVDEALLTGESRALYRRYGDAVVSGSHNLSALVHIRVTRLGAQTRLGEMQSLMEAAKGSRPRTLPFVERLAGPFVVVLITFSAACCLGWWPESGQALSIAVAIWVVSAPCALSLAVPAALLAAASALAKKGVQVRNLRALEALSRVDTLIFDKTGTLTQDAMVLDAIECRPGEVGSELLRMAAALAQHSLHPASRALCAAVGTPRGAARGPAGPEWRCDQVHESPGAGLEGIVQSDGTGEHALRLGSATYCGVSPLPDARYAVYLSDARGWLATFTLDEALRTQAALVVTQLNQAQIDVRMMSGDKPDAVRRMARVLGIQDARGACSPLEKLQVVRDLQRQSRVVAMVGDGLNDGPALAGADVSFALGNAVPSVQECADFVVLGDHLSQVADAVALARKAMRRVRQSVMAVLALNAIGVLAALAGELQPDTALLGLVSTTLLVAVNGRRLMRPVAVN